MLDIKFVRENPDVIDEACASRQNAHWDRERFFELDAERRQLIVEVEGLQAERNAVSKQIGQLMREGKRDEAEAAKAQVAANKDRIASLDEKRGAVEQELFDLVAGIPNIPDETVPYGKDDSDNPEARRWGTPREFDFEPKAHWDLGPELGMIDFDRGVKIAGSRFYVLGGMGARMERALINFMIDMHTKIGFKEWWPPVVTNAATLFGTGQLPKFEEDLYHVNPDLYLIPTAEVMLTNLHRDEVLDGDMLPLWYCAFTPCFREEAGSAGRDTRGIIRVHEFDKVEMVKFARPEDSMNQLESMTNEAEAVLQALGLPYRVVTLCTGDIGFSARKTYDVEVWLPSYNNYKEISSCSNCWDFQARRANIRYKDPAEFKGTRLVHTLNGSGLAVGRTMAAIM
ncbi:MAG: serine--tRNA ligase, partial [Atopobiaceae bacterium]|nr:serine--tRNA ligase [Atopobiaceae bacterium]